MALKKRLIINFKTIFFDNFSTIFQHEQFFSMKYVNKTFQTLILTNKSKKVYLRLLSEIINRFKFLMRF